KDGLYQWVGCLFNTRRGQLSKDQRRIDAGNLLAVPHHLVEANYKSLAELLREGNLVGICWLARIDDLCEGLFYHVMHGLVPCTYGLLVLRQRQAVSKPFGAVVQQRLAILADRLFTPPKQFKPLGILLGILVPVVLDREQLDGANPGSRRLCLTET